MGRARRGPVDGRWGRGIRRPGKQRSDERPVPSELAGSFAEGLANGFGQNGFENPFLPDLLLSRVAFSSCRSRKSHPCRFAYEVESAHYST